MESHHVSILSQKKIKRWCWCHQLVCPTMDAHMQKISGTGTRTPVSCVKGKYANHLHHTGASVLQQSKADCIFQWTLWSKWKLGWEKNTSVCSSSVRRILRSTHLSVDSQTITFRASCYGRKQKKRSMPQNTTYSTNNNGQLDRVGAEYTVIAIAINSIQILIQI